MKLTVIGIGAALAIVAAAAGYRAYAGETCPPTATAAQCAAHWHYVHQLRINPPGPDQASWYVRLRDDLVRAMLD